LWCLLNFLNLLLNFLHLLCNFLNFLHLLCLLCLLNHLNLLNNFLFLILLLYPGNLALKKWNNLLPNLNLMIFQYLLYFLHPTL
jgi:ABC-type maltose transport system permease subunit